MGRSVAKIAGQDYCSVDDGDIDDNLKDSFVPGGVKVINSKGGAGQNDQESKIKAGR